MLQAIGELAAAVGLLGLAATVVISVVLPMAFGLLGRRP